MTQNDGRDVHEQATLIIAVKNNDGLATIAKGNDRAEGFVRRRRASVATSAPRRLTSVCAMRLMQ
jgi:hypothetical protein